MDSTHRLHARGPWAPCIHGSTEAGRCTPPHPTLTRLVADEQVAGALRPEALGVDAEGLVAHNHDLLVGVQAQQSSVGNPRGRGGGEAQSEAGP